jgi:putative iron-regulated protein
MTSLPASLQRLIALVAGVALVAVACGDDGDGGVDPATMQAAVDTYAEGVHASYAASVASAAAMGEAIDAFLADPNDATLAGARAAWIAARDDYGPTEAFRFYGGPIDDEESGPEGLINAWPLDEAYIDYVEGAPDSGIVNDPDTYPTIDAALLVSLNEEGGETNISTGWHAIEFLLWGQDLSLDGPGDRPADDYRSADSDSTDSADRRAAYLAVATDLLLGHLGELEAAWAPDADNYRAEFVALDPDEAMRRIVTGIGELARGELAGERMDVAYSERSQEDEHSCFSDNTTADLVGNARGVQMVITGDYPGGVGGTGVRDVVAEVDAGLADRLDAETEAALTALRSIPAPFDQHLADGVSDDSPGRRAILDGIEALGTVTDTIVEAAEAVGVPINVS